jgi:hypothetical protein
VPNWSISRNYKNIWNSTKYSVTTGLFVTHRPHGAKPQVKEAQGPAGQGEEYPLGGYVQVTGAKWDSSSRFRPRLCSYIRTSVHKSIPCPRVSGNWEEWLASHVDGRPAIHHLQIDSIRSVEAPIDLNIRILPVEFTHTTLFL